MRSVICLQRWAYTRDDGPIAAVLLGPVIQRYGPIGLRFLSKIARCFDQRHRIAAELFVISMLDRSVSLHSSLLISTNRFPIHIR